MEDKIKLFLASLEGMIANSKDDQTRHIALLDVHVLAHACGLVASRWEPTVREMISGGAKVEAIKFYREKTGCTLKEAKDYVDGLTQNS